MNYIFAFLGEFGYEVLNWQGAIRKFSKKINNNDKIIIASRKGLSNFYEFANQYIDISQLTYFQNSAANMYWSHNPEINCYKHHQEVIEGKLPAEFFSKKDKKYQKALKSEIKNYVCDVLNLKLFDKLFNTKFIFSSEYQVINGVEFGSEDFDHPYIYNDLKLDNNDFIKIEPNNEVKNNVEKKLNFSLNDNYILCQTGSRQVVQRSKAHVEYKVLNELSKSAKIVLLNFDTGRNLDSKSIFPDIENCYIYNCNSFEEQSVLIANSKECVFFTEGDFRSHNYLPPFMGKNVFSVADESVFKLGTTPIDFWNKNVFKFGGQIIPVFSSKLENENGLTEISNFILNYN